MGRPQATDTDVMPTDQTSTETRTDMPPVPPMDTEPQLTGPQDTKPQDTRPQNTSPQNTRPQSTRPPNTRPQDTEESTRLRSARRSDLTPLRRGTKQSVP